MKIKKKMVAIMVATAIMSTTVVSNAFAWGYTNYSLGGKTVNIYTSKGYSDATGQTSIVNSTATITQTVTAYCSKYSGISPKSNTSTEYGVVSSTTKAYNNAYIPYADTKHTVNGATASTAEGNPADAKLK